MWAYEAIPLLGELYAKYVKDNAIPRCLRWEVIEMPTYKSIAKKLKEKKNKKVSKSCIIPLYLSSYLYNITLYNLVLLDSGIQLYRQLVEQANTIVYMQFFGEYIDKVSET